MFPKKYCSWTKSVFNLVHDASKKKLVVDNLCTRCFPKKSWSCTTCVHDASKKNTDRVQNLSSHLYTMLPKKKLVVYNLCTRVVVFFENLCTNYFAVSEIPHFCDAKMPSEL